MLIKCFAVCMLTLIHQTAWINQETQQWLACAAPGTAGTRAMNHVIWSGLWKELCVCVCLSDRQREQSRAAVLNHTAHHSQCICPARHILDLWGTNATGRWSEYTVYLFSHWRVTSRCLTSIAGFWECGAFGERLWAEVSGRGLWVCNDLSGFLFVIVHKKRKR